MITNLRDFDPAPIQNLDQELLRLCRGEGAVNRQIDRWTVFGSLRRFVHTRNHCRCGATVSSLKIADKCPLLGWCDDGPSTRRRGNDGWPENPELERGGD